MCCMDTHHKIGHSVDQGAASLVRYPQWYSASLADEHDWSSKHRHELPPYNAGMHPLDIQGNTGNPILHKNGPVDYYRVE